MSRSPPSSFVSSSSTLWATASKEWVIPAKPKPGRKPKKDVALPTNGDEEQLDSKGRRVQNRAAQRAFRERKQSQLAELQARVQMYEQGEIERNVALQTIAKRLKEDNERLRVENTILRDKCFTLERERNMPRDSERKRWRDESPSMSSSVSSEDPARKKSKTVTDQQELSTQTLIFPTSYVSSPSSIVSTPDSVGSIHRFSPIPAATPPRHSSIFPSQTPSFSSFLEYPSKSVGFEPNTSFPAFDCGFCNEDTPCVCRELALQQAAADQIVISSQLPLKLEHFEQKASVLSSPSTAAQITILDNLPAYQPPVPLRRRSANHIGTANPIFPVSSPVHPPAPSSISCSGDPSNCAACAGDSFGQAFCAAVGKSAASLPLCTDCPSGAADSSRNNSPPNDCCEDPSKCECRNSTSTAIVMHDSIINSNMSHQTIPTNDAWQQLKAHPNVSFADLSLLADVVARRSKCKGPRVVISPALGSVTPERAISLPAITSQPSPPAEEHDQPVLLTDPHAHYHEKQRARSPSKPAPEDVLMGCGRQRIREVHADAVKDALRLLDAKYSSA